MNYWSTSALCMGQLSRTFRWTSISSSPICCSRLTVTETTTIPYYVYQTISQANDVGTSSAQGVLAIVFSAIVAALLLRLLTRAFRRGLTA